LTRKWVNDLRNLMRMSVNPICAGRGARLSDIAGTRPAMTGAEDFCFYNF
jgi:hypothetical protein